MHETDTERQGKLIVIQILTRNRVVPAHVYLSLKITKWIGAVYTIIRI